MKVILSTFIIFLLFSLGSQSMFNIDADKGADLERIVFVDKFKKTHEAPDTPDAGACDQTSNKFRTFSGGIKWKSFPVTYHVDTSGFNDPGTTNDDAKAAVVRAFETWDAEEHGGDDTGKFFEESGTADAQIRFSWRSIDGEGETLGFATFSYNSQSKTIQSATIVLDSLDKWRVFDGIVCGDQGIDPTVLEFDIEDVAAHEVGHAIGFDHVNGANSEFNTEYPFIIFEGETHKTTLGLGDRLGMEYLYGNGVGEGKCPPGNPTHPKCN